MDKASALFDGVLAEAGEWCEGRDWKVRLALLGWFGYVLVRSLMDPMYHSIIGALNLGIHELGHMVFSFGGTFVMVAGGTLLECCAPLFGVVNFYRQRDFFAIALCFGWLSTVLFGVASYVGDAQAMNLPLVTPFGGDPVVAHDWNYLLSTIGLLKWDFLLAGLIRCAAVGAMAVCFICGGWLLWRMRKN